MILHTHNTLYLLILPQDVQCVSKGNSKKMRIVFETAQHSADALAMLQNHKILPTHAVTLKFE